MNKGVDKVRKSIEQRRKMRQILGNDDQTKPIHPSFPMEEEKHGYFPNFTSDSARGSEGNHHKQPRTTHILAKGFLSLLLFAGTAFLMQTNGDLFTVPKKWTNQAMTEEFPFARVHQWYQESFGSPMVFSRDKEDTSEATAEQDVLALPVNGSVSESFETNGSGIKITPEEATEVTALRDGMVVFAGKDKNTDNTVVVQHADGSETTYGYLDDLDVHVYQFIGTGEELGEFKPTDSKETMFFSIEKDDQYMDPVEVIKVDESS